MPYPHLKLFFVLAASSLISLALVGCDEQRSEQGQEVSVRGPEEKVTLAQVPAPVKATIEQVAKGGSLKVIKRGTVDGKTLYWADVMANGKEQGTVIGEDGTVISQGPVEEDDDD